MLGTILKSKKQRRWVVEIYTMDKYRTYLAAQTISVSRLVVSVQLLSAASLWLF